MSSPAGEQRKEKNSLLYASSVSGGLLKIPCPPKGFSPLFTPPFSFTSQKMYPKRGDKPIGGFRQLAVPQVVFKCPPFLARLNFFLLFKPMPTHRPNDDDGVFFQASGTIGNEKKTSGNHSAFFLCTLHCVGSPHRGVRQLIISTPPFRRARPPLFTNGTSLRRLTAPQNWGARRHYIPPLLGGGLPPQWGRPPLKKNPPANRPEKFPNPARKFFIFFHSGFKRNSALTSSNSVAVRE